MSNQPNSSDPDTWHSTACVLCAQNCGVKVQLTADGHSIARTRGDADHPASQGYLCNKASRLEFYQNRADRLLSPMRRTAAGDYESIDWDTAIGEIAAKLAAIREQHGGESVFYYGGGGQGNHLPGVYARTSLASLGAKWRSNALAQEKTGEFWVAERMFGGYNHGDFHHAQVVIFLGKNPWHSHGFHRARATLREISKDPTRTLIVIDPKRTETADLADLHLAVKPARDAWLLAGMIGILVQERLYRADWLARHTEGLEDVIETFSAVDVSACAHKSGIAEAQLRHTARLLADAQSIAVFEDLGVQMNRHSTLVSYLQRLLWMLCGQFGHPGSHFTMNGLGNVGAGREQGRSPVSGARIIAGLVPCNVIPEEILTDHPARYRAMIVESANPVHSLPDSPEWRRAMRALDLSVVIDIAMTETARQADYVLPATTQYEKAEATFFNFEFPDNFFHMRRPLFAAPAGALDEAEIHMRLAEALGAVPAGIEAKLTAVLETAGRAAFAEAVFAEFARDPALIGIASGLLYRTLGPSLPDRMGNAAALWLICQQRARQNPQAITQAGFEGEGMALGDALFDAVVNSPSGLIVSREQWSDLWQRVPGGKIQLALDDLLADVTTLNLEQPMEANADYPFLLSAGERRAYTANTIMRNPKWRKKDMHGALHINPQDAQQLNLGDGSNARISTQAGHLEVIVELSDRMQRGHLSLPNGMGLDFPGDDGDVTTTGASPNELTWNALADRYVGTPWHKSVPARLEAID